jgi:uncharacterized protein YjbJ (UPF0337 family)
LFCCCSGSSATAAAHKQTDVDLEEEHMPNTDEAEGRIKEAAGDLTGDKDLQREGKVDQASGKAKDAIDDTADKAKDALDRD